MTITTPTRAGDRVTTRTMSDQDLAAADEVLRSAFNTFVGVPDLFGDADYVHSRFRAEPSSAFVAELDGTLVGSNFTTRWGSFGFFGPLSVRPELWDQGVARRLLEPTLARLDEWEVTDAGLFTFAHSAKHVSLYRSYGFWPQYLTLVMAAPVQAERSSEAAVTYSRQSPAMKQDLLGACAEVTGAVLEGLDLRAEIEAVDHQALGDTVLVFDDELAGFAVCHLGAGSEAGSGACYVKFGAVRPGPGASARFQRLLDACFALAAEAGAGVLLAGCNAARVGACQDLAARGFRTQLQGVAMQRDDRSGFNRPDAFVIDDWR